MCKVGKRILIVEDATTISMLLKSSLSREGYNVDIAATLKEALHLISYAQKGSFKYDLALIDIGLPDGDGTFLLSHLSQRKTWCHSKFAVSADDSMVARERALDAGADDYIVKPFNLQALLSKISNAIGGTPIHQHDQEDAMLVSETERLAKKYNQHLRLVSDGMDKPMSFEKLRSCLHQLRGSAMLYGYNHLSDLATDLSEQLKSHGPTIAGNIRKVLRHEILVALHR